MRESRCTGFAAYGLCRYVGDLRPPELVGVGLLLLVVVWSSGVALAVWLGEWGCCC